MPITVRVQNFQSIKDATVVIDGFTVVTGPNNSGKTALMRAVRGVFTNPPAGALVRHGTAHLKVSLEFDDGNVVLWEKGWEKPNQKGKTVNRYTLNGKVLPSVGRGCPEEVLALGVNPIQAGSENVWPQIADQFKGVLFLVGSPGSVTAEAIANVDKVGKLSEALKLSEKSRRQVTSKLNVRREDEATYVSEVESFDGLDAVADLVAEVETLEATAKDVQESLEDTRDLHDRHSAAVGVVTSLEGVVSVDVPDTADASALQGELEEHVQIRQSWKVQSDAVTSLEGVSTVDVPLADEAKNLREELSGLATLQSQLSEVNRVLEVDLSSVVLPATAAVQKVKAALSVLRGLAIKRAQALDAVSLIEGEIATGGSELEQAEQEVASLLSELGRCPTCGSDTEHDHGEAA